MARSSQVPKFGKWDDGDDVPYTTYFDNATKAKFERMNPNDPLPHREEISETVRSNYENQKIKEGGVVRRQPESPLHHDAPEMSGRDYNGIKSAKRRGQQLSGPKHTQEDLSMEDGNMKKQLGSPLDHRSIGQPDRGATVPRFGDWDESDPSSSENYTNIFTRVREERQTEDGSLPAGTNVSSIRSRSGAENSKRCCCFPWGK
ncbi:RPM1-interacting protein 4-like isoform X3 [Cucumis melo]|uniref:RPM1-interacting protein 4-like isoform X3 n=1 Tax=Cucumis melo TaxID=3656 RepID=A0ABM3KVZ7_CUCME|nr:RPM1-interacting protein 4-like isoform X3 [Cucumis melo]XP_050941961.1 RPM1-interacting protein 4-like isoform X3 [Cucumis melo]